MSEYVCPDFATGKEWNRAKGGDNRGGEADKRTSDGLCVVY